MNLLNKLINFFSEEDCVKGEIESLEQFIKEGHGSKNENMTAEAIIKRQKKWLRDIKKVREIADKPFLQ